MFSSKTLCMKLHYLALFCLLILQLLRERDHRQEQLVDLEAELLVDITNVS
jgi:hypothetical protein